MGFSFLPVTSEISEPPPEVKIDLTKFKVPERFDHTPETVVRACLECLRRSLPEKLSKTPVTLIGAGTDKKWAVDLVKEFNAHDRRKEFFKPTVNPNRRSPPDSASVGGTEAESKERSASLCGRRPTAPKDDTRRKECLPP